MVAIYERALRDDCGLKTAQPYARSVGFLPLLLTLTLISYWDWTLDTHSPTKYTQSPVFDAIYGFGGNGPYLPLPPGSPPEVPGRTGGGCATDGPFRKMVVRMGPANDTTGNPRCLHRDLSPTFATQFLNKNITEDTISKSDYGYFARAVEGETNFEHSGIHGGGHYSVGGTLGEMGDLYNSPSGVFTAFDLSGSFFPHDFFRSAILHAPREPRSCLVVVAKEEPFCPSYGYFRPHLPS
jgi:tyrosinase